MASKSMVVEFCLDDYFSEYGFGDGDDGAAKDLGYQYRDGVVDKLNKGFKHHKLPLLAYNAEHMTIHNECMIEVIFIEKNGEESVNVYLEDFTDGIPELTEKQNYVLNGLLIHVDEWLTEAVK
jgi:hypothetical protein